MAQAESFIDNLIQQLDNISVILDIPIVSPDISITTPDTPEDIINKFDNNIKIY